MYFPPSDFLPFAGTAVTRISESTHGRSRSGRLGVLASRTQLWRYTLDHKNAGRLEPTYDQDCSVPPTRPVDQTSSQCWSLDQYHEQSNRHDMG